MITLGAVKEYEPELAEAMGKLRQQLSARHDGSAISRELIEELIESPYHDIIIAEDDGRVVGMVIVSIVMATLDRNVYMEDLVVDSECRGKGVGGKMLEAVKKWGIEHGCRRLEFTSSSREKKEGAKGFYKSHGAEVRETNAFRAELNK